MSHIRDFLPTKVLFKVLNEYEVRFFPILMKTLLTDPLHFN